MTHTRKKLRTRTNENGTREFCEVTIALQGEGDERELSITGVAGDVLTHEQACEQARAYWTSFFEEDESSVLEMNERCGCKCDTPEDAAEYVLDADGELHGLDVLYDNEGDEGDDVYVGHSWGQIRDEIDEYFPEVTAFYRWHLNHMHAGCAHQDARSETYNADGGIECLECGWQLGHGWHKRVLPARVIIWVVTGEGKAPREETTELPQQWYVWGERRAKGAEGEFQRFTMNGGATSLEDAGEQARRSLSDRYDHITIREVRPQ